MEKQSTTKISEDSVYSLAIVAFFLLLSLFSSCCSLLDNLTLAITLEFQRCTVSRLAVCLAILFKLTLLSINV